MSSADEIVMYIVVRSDLHMSPGKMAAQVGHAVQLAIRHAEALRADFTDYLTPWEAGSYAKIVLACSGEWELYTVANSPFWRAVVDEGRTEIAARTVTCAALVPMPKEAARAMSPMLAKLRLFR